MNVRLWLSTWACEFAHIAHSARIGVVETWHMYRRANGMGWVQGCVVLGSEVHSMLWIWRPSVCALLCLMYVCTHCLYFLFLLPQLFWTYLFAVWTLLIWTCLLHIGCYISIYRKVWDVRKIPLWFERVAPQSAGDLPSHVWGKELVTFVAQLCDYA